MKCERCEDEFYMRFCPACLEAIEEEGESALREDVERLEARRATLEELVKLEVERAELTSRIAFLEELLKSE